MSWAESTGVERLGLKVSRHLFLTEVTYVCQYLFTGFQRVHDSSKPDMVDQIWKEFCDMCNFAKTLARSVRRQVDAQHWLLLAEY